MDLSEYCSHFKLNRVSSKLISFYVRKFRSNSILSFLQVLFLWFHDCSQAPNKTCRPCSFSQGSLLQESSLDCSLNCWLFLLNSSWLQTILQATLCYLPFLLYYWALHLFWVFSQESFIDVHFLIFLAKTWNKIFILLKNYLLKFYYFRFFII